MLSELRIDLGAIRANVAALRALVAPARFGAVVKANAYGHGLVPVAQAIADRTDLFVVYALDEAVALRDAGIDRPILIAGPVEPADLDLAHAADAAIALWDRATYARQVASIARRRHAPFPVHVAIDTGLTRLGLDASLAPDAIAAYERTPELAIRGFYSHLAAAEELDSGFTLAQLGALEAATAQAQPGPLRHIAASAAAMLWPQTRLDLVRVGIALYGLWPSAPTRTRMHDRGLHLTPALTWRTKLVTVREVPPETAVGYGLTYRTAATTRIGVLPIGYAEGVPRLASNRGAVLVGGHRVPIVGRVCMDMTMIDLGEAPGANVGDPVTLIGTDGGQTITADDWGEWCETISYEVVARLPAQLPRLELAPTAPAEVSS